MVMLNGVIMYWEGLMLCYVALLTCFLYVSEQKLQAAVFIVPSLYGFVKPKYILTCLSQFDISIWRCKHTRIPR